MSLGRSTGAAFEAEVVAMRRDVYVCGAVRGCQGRSAVCLSHGGRRIGRITVFYSQKKQTATYLQQTYETEQE